MIGIAALSGTVKHYDWGGKEFIPGLLNLKEPANRPYAEYWLGTHRQTHCVIRAAGGNRQDFRDFIQAHPEATLGAKVAARFGDLPYLLKALDVKDMLSIQVHPTREEAEKDFEEENRRGIPLDSPSRNYRDKNHKPELMVAMGEFWLLHGFKEETALKAVLERVPELRFLQAVFRDSGYDGLYRHVMEMPHERVNDALHPLLDRILPLYRSGALSKSDEDFWAARAALTFSKGKNIDRGIFSIYLFNLVHLHKEEAIFQDAGVPHAYLEGWNVEIMASSDNVLRGGLTTKHIDVKELLKHVRCRPTRVNVIKGDKDGQGTVFKTPAPDFELTSYQLEAGDQVSLATETTDILLIVEGRARLVHEDNPVSLHAGSPAAVLCAREAILMGEEPSLVFRASVPS